VSSPDAQPPRARITFRSVVIGLLLTPMNSIFVILTEVMWQSGYPTALSLFYNVVFVLFWLVAGNAVVRRIRPSWALSPAELLIVYTMLSIASALAGHDMLQVLFPSLCHLHWAHGVDGRFGELIELAPAWLVVSDAAAIEGIYTGQESIYQWAMLKPWLGPLAWWLAFVVALCAVMLGITLLLRRQWTEHEKLAYPIIQAPLLLSTRPRTLFSSRAFWIGFLTVGAIHLLNGLHVLYPSVPNLPMTRLVNIQELFAERPWRDMGWAPVSFYPFAMAICFFIPLDLAFSSWFFWMFFKLQRVLASYIGMQGMPGFPYIEEQTAGGYYAIALLAVWVSRHHLRRVATVLIGASGPDTTPEERREARLAVLLIGGGAAFLAYFCLRAGMSASIAALFFGLYFLMATGVTRIRAELGPPAVDTYGMGPHLQITRFFSTADMARANPRDLSMLGFLSSFARTSRSHPMPHMMEGFRIAERLGARPAPYLLAMGIAVATGAVCAFWAMLIVNYRYGMAAQVQGLPFFLAEETWSRADTWLNAPARWQAAPIYALGLGFLFAMGMATLRMHLAWWPFHPVGFAMGGAPWTMDLLWMSFLVTWLIKLMLLRYGGAKAYRAAVPFFVGLMLGDFIIGGLWNVYGTVLGVDVYHFWPY